MRGRGTDNVERLLLIGGIKDDDESILTMLRGN